MWKGPRKIRRGRGIRWRQIKSCLPLLCAIGWLSVANLAAASEHQGQVTFGGLPVRGGTVPATQGSKELSTITDRQGLYSFPELTDGRWTIEAKMTGFSTIKQDVAIAADAPAAKWELKMLPLDQVKAEITSAVSPAGVAAPQAKSEQTTPQDNKDPEIKTSQEDLNQLASDGLLINGSVNNGAASPFAQFAAFGNNRSGAKGLYNGGIGMILDNAGVDARPFSLSGQNTTQARYHRGAGVMKLGRPLRIPPLRQ